MDCEKPPECKELRLSVSKVKTFDQCRRKYYYQYILKLPTSKNQYNALGSMVHLLLELMFKKWIASKYEASLPELLREAWFESQDSEEVTEATKYAVLDDAKGYAKQYCLHYLANEVSKPVQCEPKFELPIQIGPSLRIRIKGFIDRIDKIGERKYIILDYKTNGSAKYLDDFQLGIYIAACLAGPYAGCSFDAAYILLKLNNDLKHMKNPNELYKKQVDKMVDFAIKIEEAETRQIFPPKPGPLCGFCEFKMKCMADTGGADRW